MTQAAVTLLFGSASAARVPNLGASGAIAAVLGAFFILYPTARIRTLVLVFFVQIPAWVYLGGWSVYQLVEGRAGPTSASANGGGVAFFAHIGGFAFGALVTPGAGLIAARLRSAPASSGYACAASPSPSRSSSTSWSSAGGLSPLVTLLSVAVVEGRSADCRLSSRSRSLRRLRRSSTSSCSVTSPPPNSLAARSRLLRYR